MTLDVVAYGETTFTVRGTAIDPDAPGVARNVAFIGHDAASSSWIELYDGMTNTDGEIVHSFAYVNLEGYDLLRLDAVHGGTVYSSDPVPVYQPGPPSEFSFRLNETEEEFLALVQLFDWKHDGMYATVWFEAMITTVWFGFDEGEIVDGLFTRGFNKATLNPFQSVRARVRIDGVDYYSNVEPVH